MERFLFKNKKSTLLMVKFVGGHRVNFLPRLIRLYCMLKELLNLFACKAFASRLRVSYYAINS